MTALAHIAPYEVVTGHHHFYRLDELADKFGGGLLVSGVTGPDRYTFTNALGTHTVTLDVPYCSCCDEPLDGAVCDRCQLIHADLSIVGLTAADLADPFQGRVE